MKKLKQTFNKAAAYFHSLSPKKKFASVAASAGVAVLAMDMLIMPLASAGRLQHKLDDAIQANNTQQIDTVLHDRYAYGMWSGVKEDEWGNDKKAFLAPRVCEATRDHKYAALDTLTEKRDPEPFTQGHAGR